MPLSDFRELAEDTYLQVFLLVQHLYPDGSSNDGAAQYLNMIEEFRKSDASSSEVLDSVFFSLQSIELALKDDMTMCIKQYMMNFLKELLTPGQAANQLISNSANLKLKKSYCQVVYELASFLQEMPEFVHLAIMNVLSVSDSIELLRNHGESDTIAESSTNLKSLEKAYIRAIGAICQYCPSKVQPAEFTLMQEQLLAKAGNMSKENLTSLMESLCDVCQAQMHNQGVSMLQQVYEIPVKFFMGVVPESADRVQLLKANALINGALLAGNFIPKEHRALTINKLIEAIWPKMV